MVRGPPNLCVGLDCGRGEENDREESIDWLYWLGRSNKSENLSFKGGWLVKVLGVSLIFFFK